MNPYTLWQARAFACKMHTSDAVCYEGMAKSNANGIVYGKLQGVQKTLLKVTFQHSFPLSLSIQQFQCSTHLSQAATKSPVEMVLQTPSHSFLMMLPAMCWPAIALFTVGNKKKSTITRTSKAGVPPTSWT